jgi:hypothetical protein
MQFATLFIQSDTDQTESFIRSFINFIKIVFKNFVTLHKHILKEENLVEIVGGIGCPVQQMPDMNKSIPETQLTER